MPVLVHRGMLQGGIDSQLGVRPSFRTVTPVPALQHPSQHLIARHLIPQRSHLCEHIYVNTSIGSLQSSGANRANKSS